MSIPPQFRAAFTGIIIGSLAGLGAIPSASGLPMVAGLAPQSALAYDCSNWTGTNNAPWAFTGLQPGGHSDFGAVQSQITISQPVYVCPNTVNAYSVMLGGPSKSVAGCTGGDKWAFIQAGWIIDGNYSIHHYWENSPEYACDPAAKEGVITRVPELIQRCDHWAVYKANHPFTRVSPTTNVVVKAFFVEHIAVGVGGRRGGLYARRVPNRLLIHQNDRTPFVLVELGDTRAGRKMPSGHWVVLHGTFNQNQCVVYDVTSWKHSTA